MILEFIIVFLLFTLFTLFFTSQRNINSLQKISLISSSIVFILSFTILIKFDFNTSYFQFIVQLPIYNIFFFNTRFVFGVDGLSSFFLFLSSFLSFLCIVFVQKEKNLKFYLITLFVTQVLLVLVFTTLDLFLFYVFFEAILIPMSFLIGLWGSRERKVRAFYLLLFYTIVGSLLLLISILYIYKITGTTSYELLSQYGNLFSKTEEYFLWIGFFFSFASKVPLFPFHIWLPEVHVEASTPGSVLLAGILLKLGVYGFLRYSLVLFPDASYYFSPLIYTLSVLGIVSASLNGIMQTDLKRIVAYSSIAHMNVVVLGLFSFTLYGIEGSLLQSLSHGFVAGSLFFLIGFLYSRYHTRILHYYRGITQLMPIFSSLFLIFSMSNIALPGTSSFIGEFLLLLGIYSNNSFIAVLSSLSVIFSGAYSLWMYNRFAFGVSKFRKEKISKDLNFQEILIIFPMLFAVFLMGIYPVFFLKYFNFSLLMYYLYF